MTKTEETKADLWKDFYAVRIARLERLKNKLAKAFLDHYHEKPYGNVREAFETWIDLQFGSEERRLTQPEKDLVLFRVTHTADGRMRIRLARNPTDADKWYPVQEPVTDEPGEHDVEKIRVSLRKGDKEKPSDYILRLAVGLGYMDVEREAVRSMEREPGEDDDGDDRRDSTRVPRDAGGDSRLGGGSGHDTKQGSPPGGTVADPTALQGSDPKDRRESTITDEPLPF